MTKAIVYRIGQDPQFLKLPEERTAADIALAGLLTRDWIALPLFKWIGEPMGEARGVIGWYMLSNPDAAVDSKRNHRAIQLYMWARGAQGSRRAGQPARLPVLFGTVVLVCMFQPWTDPTVDRALGYVDITAGANRGDVRYIGGNPEFWPKEEG